MREKFEVRFNPSNNGFEMRLANGIIKVPEQRGCYVLSTGCGSGKTECCKSIIRQRNQDGILYCVDTIAELDKMFNWIVANADEIGIDSQDVIIISSDPRHSSYLALYQNNPEILMQKKVVLITHVRFWTDLINYFLIYQPKNGVKAFDGDFKTLMGRSDLRKFVLFDETPKFIKPFFQMQRGNLCYFTSQDSKGRWICDSPDVIEKKYHSFIQNSSYNPFQTGNTKIMEIKRAVIFNMIPEYYTQWICSKDNNCDITFTPLNLSQPLVNTHILVLEGVGNVLFQDSTYYKLLDIKEKYNCSVQFEPFKFDLKRRVTNIDTTSFNDFIKWLSDRIFINQNQQKKTLVAVWKNFGPGNNSSIDYGYWEMVCSSINANPLLDKERFRIIYYGSPESKSTNEFRDYDEIVLAGKWNIVNSETDKFNRQYGVKIANERHRLWAFIQLLCRIGIRMHDGKKYSVCYSSDYDAAFISQMKEYLENKDLPLNIQKKCDIPDWLINQFEEVKIRTCYYDEILALCKWDEFILECIRRNQGYECSISLQKLHDIIHRSRRKKSEYAALVKSLKKLRISLRIK